MVDAVHADALTGKGVVVVGASGGIGEGICTALLGAGARVLATGRDRGRLSALTARLSVDDRSRQLTRELDVNQLSDSETRSVVQVPGRPIDAIVLSIGNWGPPGRRGVLDISDEVYRTMIEDNVTAHFRAARSLTPLLTARGGTLVHLTGFSAEIPFPYASLVGATNAAKKSLFTSLSAEMAGTGIRVYELVIGPIRTRPKAAMGADSPDWLSAEDLGRHIAGLVAGTGPLRDEPLQYLLDRASGVHTAPPVTASRQER